MWEAYTFFVDPGTQTGLAVGEDGNGQIFIAVLISTGVRHGRQGLAEVAIPEAYGMAMALMWIWVGREPLAHLLKDNVPGISTRHVDSLILLGMLVFTLACYPAATPNSEFNWQN